MRFRRNCHPDELWTKYFTSSIHVQRLREELGEPPLLQILRTFKTADEARSWEHRVLRRLRVRLNPKFINRAERPAPPSEKHPDHIAKIAAILRGRKYTPERLAKCTGPVGKTWTLTEETKSRMSKAKTGVLKTDEHKRKIAASVSKLVQSQETKEKRRKSLTGKPKSPEHIARVVEAKRRNREARLNQG